MADLNFCVYTGRLVRPPESKGNSCFFTIACNRGYGDKQTTAYINCGASGKMAEKILEKIDQYFKGRRLGVQGNNSQNNFTDQAGNKRQSYTLWLSDWPVFLDGKHSNESDKRNAGFSDDGFPAEF